jgi:hypothetical protein
MTSDKLDAERDLHQLDSVDQMSATGLVAA